MRWRIRCTHAGITSLAEAKMKGFPLFHWDNENDKLRREKNPTVHAEFVEHHLFGSFPQSAVEHARLFGCY